MDAYKTALRAVLREKATPLEDTLSMSSMEMSDGSFSKTRSELDLGSRPGKYFKKMDRGMNIGSTTINVVAQGDKKLGYHQEVEMSKPDLIRQLATRTKSAPGTRFYLTQDQAKLFTTYYGMDLERVADEKSSLSNSRDSLTIKYDKDENRFYVVRNA